MMGINCYLGGMLYERWSNATMMINNDDDDDDDDDDDPYLSISCLSVILCAFTAFIS